MGNTSTTWKLVYGVVLVLALATSVGGMIASSNGNHLGPILLVVGLSAVFLCALLWPLVGLMAAQWRRAAKVQEDFTATMTERLQQIAIQLNEIAEQQLLSDRAKSVAYREKDRNALRRAIREEIFNKDWEAAHALANEMEKVFGYQTEAESLRREIDTNRQKIIDQRIAEVSSVIERYCVAEQWDQAHLEARNLAEELPSHEHVMRLPAEIDGKKEAFKKRLLALFQESVARHDNDSGIEILKQLDGYLTREEATTMQETARVVFKEKLTKLRTDFVQAVQDHRWTDAIRIGDSIITEFPNARAAQEVREKMDLLRQRAGEEAQQTVQA